MTLSAFDTTDPSVIDDLHRRLERFRPVPAPQGDAVGVDPALLTTLLDRWRHGYDWLEHERRIAAYPWAVTRQAPTPVRAIVSPAAVPSAPVVLLLHGWPDSVLRFERLFPLLTDVTVVAPALPGFPFAAPSTSGMSSIGMADAIADAMREFGFDRYVVSAGDVGCDVAEALAARHPAVVSALHLTDVSQYHFLVDPPTDLDDEERAYAAFGHRWQAQEGGYMHEQGTRPRTVAVALGDSPAGMAAWILEKLARWIDDRDGFDSVFSADEALTWLTAYWVTGTIGTSFAPYAAAAPKDWPPIEAPTVFTIFAKDLVNAPRRFAERFFSVHSWREFDRGGHFAAWERPSDYLWGVREAIAASRDRA